MVKERGLVSFQLETVLCTTHKRLFRACKLQPCQQFPVNKIILIIQVFFHFYLSFSLIIQEFFFSLFPYSPQSSLPDPTSLIAKSKGVASHFTLSNKTVNFQWKRWSFFSSGSPMQATSSIKKKRTQICIYSHTHMHTHARTHRDTLWTSLYRQKIWYEQEVGKKCC